MRAGVARQAPKGKRATPPGFILRCETMALAERFGSGAPRALDAERLVGTLLAGKVRVVQWLRTGGTSHVYVAERPGRTRCAVKVLRHELIEKPSIVGRFERGSLAAARIEHPRIVRTDPPDRLPSGAPYFTMELLVGLDLADVLSTTGPLAPSRALRIAIEAAEGLAAAHAAGVVHLDVKPENLFLLHARDGAEHVKIIDFEQAWIQEDGPVPLVAGSAAGEGSKKIPATPGYAAPERKTGATVDPTMDVWSLGVVLWELLTGKVPRAASGVPGENPLVSKPIAAVLARALARVPAERFPTMDAFRAALLRAAR